MFRRRTAKPNINFKPIPDPTAGLSPDLASCSQCHWSGHISECECDIEGDWEYGYYDIHLCPKCEDGGCIDDYSYSEELIQKNLDKS